MQCLSTIEVYFSPCIIPAAWAGAEVSSFHEVFLASSLFPSYCSSIPLSIVLIIIWALKIALIETVLVSKPQCLDKGKVTEGKRFVWYNTSIYS